MLRDRKAGNECQEKKSEKGEGNGMELAAEALR